MLSGLAARITGRGEEYRKSQAKNAPKIADFRDMPRDEWSQMDDKTLASNLQTYRRLVIADGRSNINLSGFPEEMVKLAAFDRVNKDTEAHPPFGKTSIDLGHSMEKFPMFEKADRTMMANLSRLIEHRERQNTKGRDPSLR